MPVKAGIATLERVEVMAGLRSGDQVRSGGPVQEGSRRTKRIIELCPSRSEGTQVILSEAK